jgi:hypothetical protein
MSGKTKHVTFNMIWGVKNRIFTTKKLHMKNEKGGCDTGDKKAMNK